ncbi:MAG: hypothetical protein H7237_03580 [Alkalinema sp. FL-bin-369]|nr:hypothetical protein [Leptolyngbyaceae cyanobacterium LF-bin-369]
MSNTQIKSIALTVLNIATVTIVFASKAFIYILIALYVVGELMFAEYAQSSPSTQPIALDTDRGDDIAEAIAKLDAPSDTDLDEDIAAIAPAAVNVAKSIARPGAVLSIPTAPIDVPNHYATLTAVQLRKECSAQNIKWRNVCGSKHLSKSAMLSALAA